MNTTAERKRPGLIVETAPLESYSGEAKDIQNVLDGLAERPYEEQEMLLATLRRYEGETGYKANALGLAAFIRINNLLQPTSEGSDAFYLTDLGAGGGDLLKALETLPGYIPDAVIRQSVGVIGTGVDLSPSLVRRFNASKFAEKGRPINAQMQIGLIDDARLSARISTGGMGQRGQETYETIKNVCSILTLDRVADPRQLIRNMAMYSGTKIIGTLLPIVPEDDNPSRQENKIVYTPKEKRIVTGQSREADLVELKKALEAEWGEPIEVAQVPYSVESAGDVQEYTLDVFFTQSKK